MSPFWRGFWSVGMYMGAFIVLAPLWMEDWDGPMRRMLKVNGDGGSIG